MDQFILKNGGYSILIGSKYYKEFIPIKKGKLVKITKKTNKHDDSRYISLIQSIIDSNDYYCIPENTHKLISPSDDFYSYLKQLTGNKCLSMFLDNNSLPISYIDYGGNKDLLDTICDIKEYNNFNIWKSNKAILKFIKHMLYGIYYLHDKKLCHLDIKPENILVNTYTKTYKLIDFGFSSLEPFDDYVYDFKGTAGYFPRQYTFDTPTEELPIILANDTFYVDGKLPMHKNRKLVYKIDSYCFGRVLYYLNYTYNKYKTHHCFNLEKKKGEKIKAIIDALLENDVNKRITIKECIDIFNL